MVDNTQGLGLGPRHETKIGEATVTQEITEPPWSFSNPNIEASTQCSFFYHYSSRKGHVRI